MSSRSWILAAALTVLGCEPTQDASVEPGAAFGVDAAARAEITLNFDRMFESLRYLASDELGGRFTLEPENLGRAADFVAEQYANAKLLPVGDSFRVPFELEVGERPGPNLHFWVETPEDVIAVPAADYVSVANGGGVAAFGSATYVGAKTPKSVENTVAVARLEAPASIDAMRTLVAALEAAGARGIVMIVPERPAATVSIEAAVPLLLIAEAQARSILPPSSTKVGSKIPDLKLSLAAERVPEFEPSYNTLAWIPGSSRPDEIVILGAHLDHIGTADKGARCKSVGEDAICNGADDNASGSAMVLEIARSLAEAGYRPKRTLVFAHFAAEELGLHGSRALANDPPDAAPFASGKVVAMINLDMVGRYRDGKGLQVGGMSSSDAWAALLAAAGDRDLQMVFERSVTGRSDHANFYRKKIPVLFFFTGLHSDYHGAGDHADKINRPAMASISEIVAHVTTAVADGSPVAWSEPRSANEGEVARLPASDASTVQGGTP